MKEEDEGGEVAHLGGAAWENTVGGRPRGPRSPPRSRRRAAPTPLLRALRGLWAAFPERPSRRAIPRPPPLQRPRLPARLVRFVDGVGGLLERPGGPLCARQPSSLARN